MQLLCHSLTWLSFIMQFVVLYLKTGESKGMSTASSERMTALGKGNLLLPVLWFFSFIYHLGLFVV